MAEVVQFHCVLGLRPGVIADPDLPEHDRASFEAMWERVLAFLDLVDAPGSGVGEAR